MKINRFFHLETRIEIIISIIVNTEKYAAGRETLPRGSSTQHYDRL